MRQCPSRCESSPELTGSADGNNDGPGRAARTSTDESEAAIRKGTHRDCPKGRCLPRPSARIVSYRAIMRVSARFYSEHMSVPTYPPTPAPGTPPVSGWSGGPGGGRTEPTAPPFGARALPYPPSPRAYPYPAYPGYQGYAGYAGLAPHPSYPAPPTAPGTPAALGPRLRSPMTVAPASPAPYTPVRPAPSFTGSLSPSQRRVLRVTLTILRSLGLFALCAMGFLIALGTRFNHEQVLKESHHPVLEAAGILTGLALLVAVFLRRRWPVPITVASALASVIAALDTTVGLIAFTTVVRRSRSLRDPVPWATGALLAAGTLTALFRDVSYGSTGSSMIGVINSSSPDPHAVTHVSIPQVLFLAVVALSLPVAVGLWLRARDGEKKARRRAQEAADASAQAERTAQEQTRTSTRLADTVSLQAERERVAREVHDGLGHRLSLLALHAAALEQGVLETSDNANAPEGSQAPDSADAVGEDDPRAAAQRVRQEAQGAMRDLRSLLAVLREPVGAVEPAPRLEDLREVVDGVLAARQPLSSSIYLDRAAQADEVLSRAVYRIVQESLTNARKHSPGTSVQLRVEGGPDTGIDITCSNRISRTEPEADDAEAGEAPQAAGADRGAASGPGVVVGDPQGGSGLRGMAQRAAICGGTFHAGPDGQGRFVVSAHLPWRSAESPRTDR